MKLLKMFSLGPFAVALAVGTTLCGVCYAKTTLPRLEPVSAYVASNETSALSVPLEAAGESRLVKTGEGTLTMPARSWTPGGPVVAVGAGTVLAEGTDDSADDSAATDFVRDNASLWLAADADHANFATETLDDEECVTCWRDVRDTDSAATNYPFAATLPAINAVSFVPPYVRTVDGLRSVYFRKFGSKCAMRMYNKSGAESSVSVGSVFFVTRAVDCWGFLLGGTLGNTTYHIGAYNSGQLGYAYYSNSRNPNMRSSRFYDNGEPRDPTYDLVQKGMHLIEFHHLSAAKGTFDSLFAHAATAARREGGDDVMELIVFNSSISETNRLGVLRYLAKKWNMPVGATFHAASGTTVRLKPSSATTSFVSGSGTYRVEATGMTLSTGGDAFFGGEVDVDPGVSVVAYSPTLAFALGAGETLNVTSGQGSLYGRSTCTLAEGAPAGTAVKTGVGAVRLTRLAADVQKLDVQGGRVTLAAPVNPSTSVSATGTNDIYATIPNANFESDVMTAWRLAGDGCQRWSYRNPGSKSWVCPYDAPEGEWVLMLKSTSTKPSSASTTVSVPAKGRYALSFMGSGRTQYGIGVYFISFIRNGVTNTCDEVDVFWSKLASGYTFHRLLTPELEAGEWTMLIAGNATGDATSTFDDFKMKLITEDLNPDGAWRLPNGGFEDLERGGVKGLPDSSLNNFTYSASNRVVSWSFTQGGSGVIDAPSVGITYPTMADVGSAYWHNPNLSRFGDKHLAFYSDGGTATSAAFTPPAGSWHLRFKSAFAGNQDDHSRFWHSTLLNNSPTWSATATVNGNEIALGTFRKGGYTKWSDVTLPNAFTVQEGDSVVISIRQTDSAGAGYIDEVELVPANELVQDGGFENATWDGASVWKRDVQGVESSSIDSYVGRHQYSNMPQFFGYDWYEGNYCLKLWYKDDATAYQDVAIPSNGLYRLTFYARTRVDNRGYGYSYNPIRVWMAKDGATNELGRTDVNYDVFRPFTYFWRAPAAGTYRLGFQSTLTNYFDHSTMIDGVSLMPVGDTLLSETPDVPETLEISVATGAELALDFPGTLKVERLRIAGRNYSGTVDASVAPDVLSGTGKIEIKQRGFMLIFR